VIAFHLPIVPPKATSQSAGKRVVVKNGVPLFFKNKKAVSAEDDLLTLCSEHRPSSAFEGPVRLVVDFVWPWRKSEPLKNRAAGRLPMTSKPDCSNVIKLLEDCLTKLQYWHDDGQVADLHVTKAWGDQVGIYVMVEAITAPPLPRVPLRKVPAPERPTLFA
jgi:Holliday junction resolvase RusA-like endonuclease